MAGEGAGSRTRAFVEDARRNGQFLRVTWHGEHQQFVISNWDGVVCVGATRVPVEQAPELVGLLVTGLAEAASMATSPAEPPAPRTLREHLSAWWHERRSLATVTALPRAGGRRTGARRSA